MQSLALKPGSVRHYVEFHIEQGPQLEAAGLALGVVSGIAGQTWLSVSIEGVQNHGGKLRGLGWFEVMMLLVLGRQCC
jgi:allantoate deiminase